MFVLRVLEPSFFQHAKNTSVFFFEITHIQMYMLKRTLNTFNINGKEPFFSSWPSATKPVLTTGTLHCFSYIFFFVHIHDIYVKATDYSLTTQHTKMMIMRDDYDNCINYFQILYQLVHLTV